MFPSFIIQTIYLILLLTLSLSLSAFAGSTCPSPIPTSSNPVGCILSTLYVGTTVEEPNALGYDWHVKPNVLLVGDYHAGIHTVAAYQLDNGQFIKHLQGKDGKILNGAGMSTVDQQGRVYICSLHNNAILVFTPHPHYEFIDIINGLSEPVMVGHLTNGAGEYLGVSIEWNTRLYRTIVHGSAKVQSQQACSAPATLFYSYGGIFDPRNGHVTEMDQGKSTLNFYSLGFENPNDVKMTLDHQFTPANSLIPKDSGPASYQIDQHGHIFVLIANLNGDVSLIIMKPDGSNAIATPSIDTGINQGASATFMTISPDGSVVYIADPKRRTVVAIQGLSADTPKS